MKKILSIFLAAGIATFVACGPSAEEKAAMEKARQDSIAAVEKARQDSMEAVNKAMMDKMKADSTASADMEKARQDSIQAAGKKKSSVKKSEPKTDATPKTKTLKEKMEEKMKANKK
jgi:hypothetical protein